jgi:hypothetical protein
MHMLKPAIVRLALLLPLALAGCDGFMTAESSNPVDDGLLTAVRVAPDAPPLETTEVSFWIVRGEEREVQISYGTGSGYRSKCVRFIVPADGPLRHADGSVFAVGDSARVTVRVVDHELFLFEFDPAGLRFNPSHPARIEVRYRWMADDLNGDGTVDADDQALASDFGLWKQEATGQPWTEVPSARDEEIQELHADLTGFTRYMLASD